MVDFYVMKMEKCNFFHSNFTAPRSRNPPIQNLYGPYLKAFFIYFWTNSFEFIALQISFDQGTRMHSSRMRPAARRPYAESWGCLLLVWGGSAWSGGWVCVCLVWGGFCLVRGVYPSMHWGRHPPVWTEFLTHACENITLAQLRCGR